MVSCVAQILLLSLISIFATIILAVIIFAAYVADESERFISAFNRQFDLFCETSINISLGSIYTVWKWCLWETACHSIGVYEKPLAVALMDISTNTSISNCSNILPIPNPPNILPIHNPPGFTHQLRIEGIEPVDGSKLMFAYIFFWNRYLCHAAIAFTGTEFLSECPISNSNKYLLLLLMVIRMEF